MGRTMDFEADIKNKALELGFDLVGITAADPIDPDHRDHLQRWLDAGCHGPLAYMERNLDKRLHPAALLQGARSVICVGLRYRPLTLGDSSPARIAAYAQYEDYHPFIKDRLHQLAAFVDQQLPKSTAWKFKAAVDSVPLAEKTLAWQAGLGFIGRNHLLIHPEYGGSILLGELVTTLGLQPDSPLETIACDGCDRCVRACPTGALRPDGLFDARRCISCLTQYESAGPMFPQQAAWLFGCDVCLNVCPYTRQTGLAESALRPVATKKIDPEELLLWDQAAFEEHLGGTCIRHIGLGKLRKNAEICRKFDQ